MIRQPCDIRRSVGAPALGRGVLLMLAFGIVGSATAQGLPDYRDDRSTPEAVIESLYNALNRQEYTRAWSYFRDEPDRPDFETFAKGYADTTRVRVRLGAAITEGAAGSILTRVPAVVEATRGATVTVFSGCYELRLVQPAAQLEPPFQPLGIVRGNLRQSKASFEEGDGDCAAPQQP